VVHLRDLESENDLKKKTWTLKSEQHINKQVKQYWAVLPLLPLLPLPTVSHSGALSGQAESVENVPWRVSFIATSTNGSGGCYLHGEILILQWE